MASQVVKLYLRIRNSKETLDYSTTNTKIEYSNESVTFHKVFTKDSQQVEIYDEIGKPLTDNLLRGINGILLVYGTSGSGKSYTLLGDNGNEGLIPRLLEDIFSRVKILKSKKSIAIILSCFEIYNDRIKDLAKVLSDGKQRYGEESLEIREHHGNVYIDNLTVTQIESIQEAQHMIQEGKRLRRSQVLGNENLSHIHTVFKITVSQKEMNMTKSGVLTLVDLADSDSGESSIAKTLSGLKNLLVDLQQGHHASSDECTLSKILSNNLKHHCLTSVLFNVHPGQQRQTLETLSYANSCYLHTSNTSAENLVFKSHQQTNRMKKLQDEIRDLKHTIDKSQEHHELKLRSFGEIIGFNIDVESVTANPNSSERKMIEKHLDSVLILDEVQHRNKRLESKLGKNGQIFEEIQKFELKNKEKFAQQVRNVEEQIRGVKIQIIELNERISDNIRKRVSVKSEEFQQILLANHMELEEKAAVIQNLPFTLQSIASDMRAITDYKDMGRAELEHDLVSKYDSAEESHCKALARIRSETEASLKAMEQETRRFELECNSYLREKLSKISAIQQEIISIYNLFQSTDRLIKEVESGQFTSGIKPIYMTVHDMPKHPAREKFPYLFKTLKENGILTSQKDNNFIRISNNLFTKKYVEGTQKNFSKVKSTFQLTFPQNKEAKSQNDSKHETEKDLNEPSEDYEKLLVLRSQASQMQRLVNELGKKNKGLRSQNNDVEAKIQELENDLKRIVADRDRHKDFYAVLMKNKIESKVVIDSQKRLMDKYTFITEQISSRPTTAKRRPLTASGIRVGLAKKMGNSNCSKCCRGEIFRNEIDLIKDAPCLPDQFHYTTDPDIRMKLPSTVFNHIAPIIKLGNTQLEAVFKLQALCKGHLERKQFYFLRSLRANKIPYFSKNDLMLTLGHKPVTVPIEEELTVRSYTYPSGSVYSGQWLRGFRHGIGTMKWPDSCAYQGNWQFGYPSGKGKFTYFDGETFEGPWLNPYPLNPSSQSEGYSWLSIKHEFYSNFEETHKRSSSEIMSKHNSNLKSLTEPKKRVQSKMAEIKRLNFTEVQPGCKYQGEMKSNKRHGFGKNIWEIGDVYEGQWEDDQQSGWGKNSWIDGSEFFGFYVNGVKQGLGDYLWEDKTQYTGEWNLNKMHGVGKYVFADSREYLGQWNEGLMHGFGMFVWPDGRRYEGYWKNNKKDGIGISFTSSGSSHTDMWSKGKMIKKR